MKRLFSTLLFAATMVFFADQALADTNEDAAWKKEPAYGTTIKIGYNGGLCSSPLGIALVKGFYKEEGIDAKILSMAGGGAAQLDTLGTGKVQVTSDHTATLLVPAINGLRMIFTTAMQTGCKSLYVLASSDIKSTKDMEGKTIAIPDGIGASDNNITLRFLLRDHVDAKKVKFKMVDSGASVLAMQSGEIQGALLGDQFAKPFLDNGTLRIIRSLTFDDDFKIEPCCLLALNLDFYEQNPITAKKITKAIIKTRNWIANNPEEAVDISLKNNWASGDRDVAIEMLKTYDFTISDEATEKSIIHTIDDYKEFGIIAKNTPTPVLLKKVWAPIAQ